MKKIKQFEIFFNKFEDYVEIYSIIISVSTLATANTIKLMQKIHFNISHENYLLNFIKNQAR